uniref:Tetratricopeptide (TPR) repeat n=1 Tax=Candidatus Kentrum sp. DK TaxID=2126562 RepID=A0A450SE48_9GAMM|nr:MAG: Tetratricopeptide (TPR) repeat [Candidatus Kentron sp. DK]
MPRQPQQLTIKQALSQAKKAAERGNATSAMDLYHLVLRRQPDHPIAQEALQRLQKQPKPSATRAPMAEAPADRLQALFDLYHAGQTAQAEKACRKLLQTWPDAWMAWNLLGMTLRGRGKLTEAVEAFDQAIQRQPDFVDAWNNRGVALQQMGRLEEALESYDKVTTLNPDLVENWYNRGIVLKRLERREEAVESYDRALRLRPGYADCWNNRGVALQQLERLEEAVESYDNALRFGPDDANTWQSRGDALQGLGRWEEAVESYDHAIRLDPDSVDLCLKRGLARQDLGRMEEAVEDYDRVITLNPERADVHNHRGTALTEIGRSKEALESYEEALRLAPDHADAYSGRGSALMELGRMEEALESCDRAIRLAPGRAGAYASRANVLKTTGQLDEAIRDCEKALALDSDLAWVYGTLGAIRKFQPGDPRVEKMEALLAKPNLREADRRLLCFALADAYEGLGDYDRSFRHLEEGNRLRKRELGYTIDKDRRIDARVREIFSTRDRIPTAPPGAPIPIRPLFIVGMPRSGTSLVEQILASHSKVHGAGELGTMTQLIDKIPPSEPNRENSGETAHPLPKVAVDIVRDGYLAALTGLNVPETVITDKMPLNFRWIGFILAAFPEARIIHTNRDPLAICWSNYKHNFKGKALGYAYDLGDLAEFYRMYQGLMAFWRERYPEAIYDLSYERLTENQEEETRKLLAFCALEWEDQCLAFHKTQRPVRTASAVQVRKKMYRGSSEAWRNYEEHLRPLITALEAPPSPADAAASDSRRSGDADAPAVAPKPVRQCWPCTGCCDGWVRMEIGGEPVSPGHPCPHSTGEGCGIYTDRPTDPCRDFDCGWIIEDSPLPDWMRPDRGKVIVLFGKLDWNGQPVDLAVPVGERIPPESQAWLEGFSRKHKRPLVYTEQVTKGGEFQQEQRVFGYGPPEFQQDLLRWQQEGRALW